MMKYEMVRLLDILNYMKTYIGITFRIYILQTSIF